MRRCALPGLAHYMAQYDHEHTSPWNRLLHGVGIPLIFAGAILAILTWWRLGAALFVGGWLLLFLGHRIEGNRPAFFQGAFYLLVGPVWVAKEMWHAVTGSKASRSSSQSSGPRA